MVGIPRSQGCHTCRRRKVKCDSRRPSCLRCEQSSRKCEGYEKYSVFLNRSVDGMIPRSRLEEALVISDSHQIEIPSESPSILNDSPPSSPAQALQPTKQSGFVHSISSIAMQDEQLISSFIDLYMPAPAHRNTFRSWMINAACSAERGPALHNALKALSLSRAAWQTGCEDTRRRGRKVYGLALTDMQTALNSDVLSKRDETLAAARALLICDLFDAKSMDGWHKHSLGTALLVRVRGAANYKSVFGRALLKDYLSAALIHGIQSRRRSFLVADDWRNLPWAESGKLPEQTLCDLGLQMTGIVEDLDQLQLETDDTNSLQNETWLARCDQLDADLIAWHDALGEREAPNLLYWMNDGSDDSYAAGDFEFPNIRMALDVTLYWALRLHLKRAVTFAIERFRPDSSRKESRSTARYSGEPCSAGDAQIASEFFASQCFRTKRHSDETPKTLATNIVRSIAYCFRPDCGLYASHKAHFALRSAQLYFESISQTNEPPPWQLDRCYVLHRVLVEGKGLSFAQAIQNSATMTNVSHQQSPVDVITQDADSALIKERLEVRRLNAVW